MPFEKQGYREIQLLDPALGECIVDPMEEVLRKGVVDQLYILIIIKYQEHYINPTLESELSCFCICFFTIY